VHSVFDISEKRLDIFTVEKLIRLRLGCGAMWIYLTCRKSHEVTSQLGGVRPKAGPIEEPALRGIGEYCTAIVWALEKTRN